LVKIMRRALQTSRDNRYATASAMQTDLEKFLKSATALGTAHELGEYLKCELPPQPVGSAPSTSAQLAGTQRQPEKPRTEVQVSARPPTPNLQALPLPQREATPLEIPDDSEEIPTTPDGA